MSKNILFHNFPKCYQLFELEGLFKQHVEVEYNPANKTGRIMICYIYKGLYVIFYGQLDEKDEFYEIKTRLKGFEETHVIENSTVLDENIPGFVPIKIITKRYSLKKLIISAYKKLL